MQDQDQQQQVEGSSSSARRPKIPAPLLDPLRANAGTLAAQLPGALLDRVVGYLQRPAFRQLATSGRWGKALFAGYDGDFVRCLTLKPWCDGMSIPALARLIHESSRPCIPDGLSPLWFLQLTNGEALEALPEAFLEKETPSTLLELHLQSTYFSSYSIHPTYTIPRLAALTRVIQETPFARLSTLKVTIPPDDVEAPGLLLVLAALRPRESHPVPLPVLGELWLPEKLENHEWWGLQDVILTRDVKGCRGLHRLYGDWPRISRGETEEETETFSRGLDRLYGVLGKTLKVLGGPHMTPIDDDISKRTWANIFQNQSTEALRKLKLFKAADITAWVQALDEGGSSMAPNLERLECIGTPLKGESMACLVKKLLRGDWHKLDIITFTDGGLDDSDVMPLASAMRRSPHQYTSLRVLNLNCNMLTASSITALAHMLQEGNCPGLMELNVGDNPIGDAGISALMGGIQGGAPCNATLEYIGLDGCDIGWEAGARVYVEAWADGFMPKVVTHSLGGNPIGLDGIRALCRMYTAGRMQRKHILLVDIWGQSGIDAFLDVIRQEQAPGLLLVDPGDKGGYFYELLKEGLAVLGKERLLMR